MLFALVCTVVNPAPAPHVPLQGERKRCGQGENPLVRSAFLFSSVLPSTCEDVLLSRTCSSLCSALIPEDDGWGSNWQEIELEQRSPAGSTAALPASEPSTCSGMASPPPAGTSVWSSRFLVPSVQSCAALSPGAVHQTGWLVLTGRWVLVFRSVPDTVCSLRAREGTCLAFALVKHLAQNVGPELRLC